VAEISGNFDGPNGARVPVRVRDAQRLYDAYRVLAAETATTSPLSVIHGDAHVGNVFLDRDGHPAFVDWQCVQRGPWYLDVGYHIASAITIADRRRAEQDLLRHYLDQLAALGVDAPSWDDAWRMIGRGMLHGFYLWGITLKVDPPIIAALLERLGTAVDDHNVYEALGV
jgi:thiamine kinase-like enzyme